MLGARRIQHAPVRVLAYADSVEFSGAESAFAAVVAALALFDDMTVEAAVPEGQLAETLRRAEIPVHELPRIPVRAGVSALDPRLSRRARAIARSGCFQAVLVNLPSAQAGTPGLATGLPSVAFLHIPHSLAATGFKLGAIRDVAARPLIRRADRIIVPAPSGRRTAIAAWGFAPEQVSWAPPPFRRLDPVPRGAARARLGLDGERTIIGIVGRITIKQKGHDLLLEAVARLRRKGADVGLLVVGSGADARRVRDIAVALGLAGCVRLLGRVGDPADVYGALDALALPSRFEGLPLVALEALSLSVPGVASRVDGLADVWMPEWLVEPGDAGDLAAQLGALLAEESGVARARVRAWWSEHESRYTDGTVERFACQLRSVIE